MLSASGILATLESKSEHPIAHAITTYARDNDISLNTVSNFSSLSKARGSKGVIEGMEYFVGNGKLISELGLSPDATLEHYTAPREDTCFSCYKRSTTRICYGC